MQYLIREQTTPLAREIVIEDRHGRRMFRAHGPVVRVRDELRVDDRQGIEQVWIKEPLLGDGTRFNLYRGGARCASVTMIAVGNLLEGFDLDITDTTVLHARGDMLGRDFTLLGAAGIIGRVRRHNEHAIELETASGQDDTLLVAGVLAMCTMTDAWARAGTRRH